MPKRTFQPNNRRRAKTHGFRARMATKNGRWCSSVAAPRAASADTGALLNRCSEHEPGAGESELALPKRRRLYGTGSVPKVYAEGQRYDGRFAGRFFAKRTSCQNHRLGVTASTKAVGKSVDRNRARRLLRELFRRSAAEIEELKQKYDWVLNAKRSLLVSDESAASASSQHHRQVAQASVAAGKNV